MKNKATVFTLIMAGILLVSACQNKQEEIVIYPTIPEGYVVDKNLYLAEGDGIYVFIENKTIDYETIGADICNGNAQEVKLRFEKSGNQKENPMEYAAIQNILGITEIYLGNYDRAYEYFNDTIEFVNKKKLPEKNKILTVLYNNAGATTINLSTNATNDKRLIKASKLCEEPYMGLVIAVNLTGRTKELTPKKEWGEAIVRAKELLKKETQIDVSPNFVQFSAARHLSVGYVYTGQIAKAIEVLDEYILLIPNTSEYNLTKASLLSFRGHCFHAQQEYKSAINDLQSAIALARKTVDENSRQLATAYHRIGVSYALIDDWESASAYFEKAIPGYKSAMASDKGILYYNLGNSYWAFDDYKKVKYYFFKSYFNLQLRMEDLGDTAGVSYDNDLYSGLYEIYLLENNSSLSFDEWLEKELEQDILSESITNKEGAYNEMGR